MALASGGRLVPFAAAPTTAAALGRSRRTARRRTQRTPESAQTGKGKLS